MKRLTLLSTLLASVLLGRAQTQFLSRAQTQGTIVLSVSGDTLNITDLYSVHYLQLGDKIYRITFPKPYLEEVKPSENPLRWFQDIVPSGTLDAQTFPTDLVDRWWKISDDTVSVSPLTLSGDICDTVRVTKPFTHRKRKTL